MTTFFSTVTDSAATSNYTTTWTTAATDTINYTIQLGFQGFLQGIDYVQEKIKEIFDDRAKIKQYRISLFTDKVRQSSRIIKKQPYTIMIPSKRNFRGQEAQRK